MSKQYNQPNSPMPGYRISRMISRAREETWMMVVIGIGLAGAVMHSILITMVILYT